MNLQRPSVTKKPTSFTSPKMVKKSQKGHSEDFDAYKQTSLVKNLAFCSLGSNKTGGCTPSLSAIMNERYNMRLQKELPELDFADYQENKAVRCS